MDIDQRLLEIIEILNGLGHKTLIVGGAVRNQLLNLKIKDYDLATSASIELVSKVFKNSSIIYRDKTPWAIQIDHKGFNCEISTFRIEEDYRNRLPQKITYVNHYFIDVFRRDYTINALAYSLSEGYLDYVGGMADLQAKLLRIIGDPKIRFTEDPMRILRGLRLSATLNFKIEAKTLNSIKELYPLALKSGSSHLKIEVKKILAGENFSYVFDEVNNLFMDISNNEFINKELADRSVLLADDFLYVYLKHLLNLSKDNPIYLYLNLNKTIVHKLDKLEHLINLLQGDLDLLRLQLLYLDYQKDEIDYIVKILNSFKLINEDNLILIDKVSKEGYLRLDELAISIKDIEADISDSEKYDILKKLQKAVITGRLKNKRSILLKNINNKID